MNLLIFGLFGGSVSAGSGVPSSGPCSLFKWSAGMWELFARGFTAQCGRERCREGLALVHITAVLINPILRSLTHPAIHTHIHKHRHTRTHPACSFSHFQNSHRRNRTGRFIACSLSLFSFFFSPFLLLTPFPLSLISVCLLFCFVFFL